MSSIASHSVWRIATRGKPSATTSIPSWCETDLDGQSASINGGRWNPVGVPVVYAASSVSLACLETVVHLGASTFPITRYWVEISIPDDVWEKMLRPTINDLPLGWNSLPTEGAAALYGDAWVKSSASALLQVPSVIVPMECNFLINPSHPDAARITAESKGVFSYDQRLIDTISQQKPKVKAP